MPRPAFEFRGGKENGKTGKNGRPGRPRREFTFRARPPPTSSRPLLNAARESTPEFMGGAEADGEQARKFVSLDELTDSDEAEMDVSAAEDDEGLQPPRKKQATEPATSSEVPEAPKWSNPDPYTVLPPADESQAKRKDFVKMIRKARVSGGQTKPEETNAVTSNEDFISFGDLEMEQPPEDAPRGPKSRREADGDPALGSRKRTRDDRIIGSPRGRDTRFNLDASIIDLWRPLRGQNATPWIDPSSGPTFHTATRLHNEILDFYHWVKPRPFENIVRDDLISRLQTLFHNRFPGCQLHSFGSFACGLYLPIADMDLVLLSRQFIRNGKKTVCQKPRDIYSLAGYIKNSDIAVPGSILSIPHARVPIVKFDDRLTGLRVDLSFDNTSGIAANNTFQLWKTQFPIMPVIVSVIKQFLLLRGLNEVPTGGLGGFSIICLVTSLLQHLPLGTSDPNLGSVLMDFFDFYGNQLDVRSVGIQLEPPGYFNKTSRSIYDAEQKERLSIIDPNNPDNDISGGTKEIPRILSSFAEAYRSLKHILVTTAYNTPTDAKSLLGSIIGANYDSYKSQRQQLHGIFTSDPSFARFWSPAQPLPPPPPPPPPAELPPPPPAAPPPPPSKKEVDSGVPANQSGDASADASKLPKKKQSSFDRANRLRTLRPDVNRVPKFISVDEAIKLGGYQNISQMDRDLSSREKARKEQQRG